MVLTLMVILIAISVLYLLSEYLREKEENDIEKYSENFNNEEALKKILVTVKSTNNTVKNIFYLIFLLLVLTIINTFGLKIT